MLRPKQQIFGLEVIQYCGGGAYGEVYYCRDLTGRCFALKVIPKGHIGSGWERELKGITNYRHLNEDCPGLLRIYQVGEDGENLFYTMEPADAVAGKEPYIPDTLASRLSKGPLPSVETLPVLERILDEIRLLHDSGYAHRDIKPENILFVNGSPKLADLGLLSPLTGTMTQLAGTLDYLPPEQRTGGAHLDTRESRRQNDLYAFGKLVYCCVTGNGADQFPSVPATMPLTLQNKHLFRLSRRLCDKEPIRRLTSLALLQDEFQRLLHYCQYGESLWDKLRYAFAAAKRNLCSLVIRAGNLCRRHWIVFLLFLGVLLATRQWLGASLLLWFPFAGRHWIVSVLLFCLLLGCGLWLERRLIYNRIDPASRELAQSLQEQREIAEKTEFTQKDFIFYNGRYGVAVPTNWQVFDRDAVVRIQSPIRLLAQSLHGIIVPPDANGNDSTVIAMMILPLTSGQLEDLDRQKREEMLTSFVGEDVEAISIRPYRNLRANLDGFLFVGEVVPSKAVICYFYPRKDHTLCLEACIPKERYDANMGIFLTISDSLRTISGVQP